MISLCFQEHPISLYDVDKKKLIGVFSSITAASVYLYGNKRKVSVIRNCLNRKGKLTTTLLNISIAVRTSSSQHLQLLSGSNYLLIK